MGPYPPWALSQLKAKRLVIRAGLYRKSFSTYNVLLRKDYPLNEGLPFNTNWAEGPKALDPRPKEYDQATSVKECPSRWRVSMNPPDDRLPLNGHLGPSALGPGPCPKQRV